MVVMMARRVSMASQDGFEEPFVAFSHGSSKSGARVGSNGRDSFSQDLKNILIERCLQASTGGN